VNPWIPSEKRPVSFGKGNRTPPVDAKNVKTTPIRTVEAGAMLMEMWVDEIKFTENVSLSSTS